MRTVCLVLVLWVAGLGASAQFAKVSVIFPMMQLAYPGSGPELGFLVSILSFVGLVLGLVGGLVVARFGFRTVLLASLLLGGLVSLVQALFPPLPIMLGLRTIEGVSHLGIVIAAPTFIAQLSSNSWRPFAMTLWGTFFSVSFALMAWLGIPFAQNQGASALFLLHGGLLLSICLLLALMLPRLAQNSGVASIGGLRRIIAMHGQIYASPFKSAAAAGWTFYTLTFVALLTAAPVIVDETDLPFVLTFAPLISIASSMTLGVYALKFVSAIRVIWTAFVVAAAVSLLLIAFPSSALVLIALFAVLGLIQGASFAAIPELNQSPEDRAHATGAIAQTGNIGNAIGTPIVLTIIASMGITGLAAFLCLTYIAGMAVHLYLARRRALIRKT